MTWENVVLRYNNLKRPDSTAHLKQVTIATNRDEENLTKPLILLSLPTATAKQLGSAAPSKILDLIRLEKRVTVDGYLVTGLGTSGDFDVGTGTQTYTEQTNASNKKTDLKAIFEAGGTSWMTYEGETFSVNLEKLSIVSENKDGIEPGTGEAGYSVKLTAVRGEDM